MANIAKRARDWFRNEDSGSRLPVGRSGSNMPASYFGPLSNFFSDMDRMFDNAFRNLGFPTAMPGWGMQMFRPNIDITSDENEYIVTAEVPGLDERDIRLDVSADGLLTISGEKRQESSENRKDIYRTECSYGSFERTLTLPEDVDQEGIEARFRNGVLTIVCPRTEASRQSHREIPIGGRGEGARASNVNERGAGGGQSPKKAA